MNAQDLRKLLEQTDNKFSVFASRETLIKYDFNAKELVNLINDFLSDEEKLRIFEYPHFIKSSDRVRQKVIKNVSNEDIKLQMIRNEELTEGFSSYEIVEIIKGMSDNAKEKILRNEDFLEKKNIPGYELRNIISSIGENARKDILMDKDLVINKLHFQDYDVTELIKMLQSDDSKLKMLEIYNLSDYEKTNIINTLNAESKLNTLLEDKNLSKNNKINIIRSFETSQIIDIFVQYKEFCSEHDIHPYEVVRELDASMQKEFILKLEEIDLSLGAKREILATLKQNVKDSLDKSNLPEEYKSALDIKTEEYTGKVILDLQRNLEDYSGLDNLISVNPENISEEEKYYLLNLCSICPELGVISSLDNGVQYVQTGKEYKEAEEWISSVIDGLNPEYSKAQKLAIIDNVIGKKISYSPDFDTEVFDRANARALYRIISSGYGVCNGIAKVEQYMLNRIGIESEIIGGKGHAFLKIKDIELPLANGETVKGNTILDPTWNLTTNRFGGRPDNFCMSYEEARKKDVNIDGIDLECHKNDEKLQDATLNLDDESLRKLFSSVGLADKDGQFPIVHLLDKSEEMHKIYANKPEENISKQFSLLKEFCPEFVTCQNSSMRILSDILLDNDNLKFNKCVVNRVYERNDKDKRPVMFAYIDSDEIENKFYFADKSEGQFIEIEQNEFTKRFECYDYDLIINNRC